MMGRNDPTRGGRISRTNGYSRGLGDFDPMNTAIDRGLNYGAGLLNSAGEAALSGLVDDGRARLNFRLDKDGYFNGEGDALLPFYDSRYTTIFTQLGVRSMHDADKDRWIGNFGLGQRWFPAADEENTGNWMVGYNVFLDYDFTRDHQRGGMGVEAQYDWLSLASNYYVPLSDWKGSEDFDSAFVKERAAEGLDVRAKGYLPFYRHIAVTGAYSQWNGDHVGVFGSDSLENDPNVWSYGLEYTPVPLVSGFVTQRSTERGNTATEFGLNFTYHFQMPWEDQIAPAKVAELRTVSGSRHEFVDRENRIILEYKTKNAYRIEYVGPNGSQINEFVFRVRNGFNEYKAGQTVHASALDVTLAQAPAAEKNFLAKAGGYLGELFSLKEAHAAGASQTYITDSRGQFIVRINSRFSGPVALTARAGDHTQSFTLNVVANMAYSLEASPGTLPQGIATSVTFTLKQGGIAVNGAALTFEANAGFTGLPSEPRATDANGRIVVDGLTGTVPGSQTIAATVAGQRVSVPVSVTPAGVELIALPTSGGGDFTGSTTVTFTVRLKVGNTPVNGKAVTWRIVSANNSANLAVLAAYRNLATGLAWGDTATKSPGTALTSTTASATNTSGEAVVRLTDILGERAVTVRASVIVDGSTYTVDQPLTFGRGPMSAFRLADGANVGQAQWANARPISAASSFPAAQLCGGSGSNSWADGDHSGPTNLPTRAEFRAVSVGSGNEAWKAAGWPSTDFYWTGELFNVLSARFMNINNGASNLYSTVLSNFMVVCRR